MSKTEGKKTIKHPGTSNHEFSVVSYVFFFLPWSLVWICGLPSWKTLPSVWVLQERVTTGFRIQPAVAFEATSGWRHFGMSRKNNLRWEHLGRSLNEIALAWPSPMAPVNPLQSRFGWFCFDPGPEDSERVFIHMRSVVQRTWDVLDVISQSCA